MRIKNYLDAFTLTLIAILIVGILVPIPASAISVLTWLGTVAVMVLFLVYGMRLPTREVWDGLRNIRLQGAVLVATFVLFPLLGVATHPLFTPLLGAAFATGTLYLTLLPSTVQSSVSFTSIAGGNIAGAVCAATISNISGMFLTPILVMLVMGASTGVGWDSVVKVVIQLLLPFIVGQFLQPYLGERVRASKWLTKGVDRGTIIIVVTAGVAGATARGLWDDVTWIDAVELVFVSAVILAVMLALTWFGGKALKLNRADRIALLMCGSKKSLATGLPMAAIIFPVHIVAAVTVPVIVFHQLQLMVAAVLARHLAITGAADNSTW